PGQEEPLRVLTVVPEWPLPSRDPVDRGLVFPAEGHVDFPAFHDPDALAVPLDDRVFRIQRPDVPAHESHTHPVPVAPAPPRLWAGFVIGTTVVPTPRF